MNTIIKTNRYPIFVDNQVLTNDDLNNLFNYLHEQNRLTRAYTIGMGIICGMELSSSHKEENKDAEITKVSAKICISAGCGITSEGYVISLSSIKLTHYLSNVKVDYRLFAPSDENQSTKEYKVVELFEKNPNNQKGRPLYETLDNKQRNKNEFDEFIADRVLVVVCETQDNNGRYGFLEYTEISKYKNFSLRFFLLPRHNPKNPELLSAETLLSNAYQDELKQNELWKDFSTEAIFEARNHFFQDFAPQVQRFGYAQDDLTGKSVDLTKINDYKAFRDNYYQICEHAIAAIGNAFTNLFRLFSPFFSSFQPNSDEKFIKLEENLTERLKSFQEQKITVSSETVEPPEPLYALQYFYDYLSLLVAAYYELAEAAFDLMDDCTPNTQRFPKFLMLGIVPSPDEEIKVYQPASAYRSHFTQPPIYNSNQVRVKQVRHLYERLLKLCEIGNKEDSFYPAPFYNAPLKITPSKDQSVPLSEQAIPYYLNYAKLYLYWNYDAYRKGRSHLLPAYFSLKEDEKKASIPMREDLVYRLDDYNFYRIEGHVGKANGDVLKHIQEYQQRYNLAFDVISLKIGSQASLDDLNISGQFKDLETDFSWMKDSFQEIWKKYKNEPINVLLHTLKQVFFDQSDLTLINSNQLFNPILEIARKPEKYEFVPVDLNNSQNTSFKLYLHNDSNTPIARYLTLTSENDENQLKDLEIDFSKISNNAIDEEKQRIAKEIADCLTLSQVTYGIVIDSSSKPVKYHLKLSIKDKIKLPSSNTEYSPILLSENYFTVSSDDKNYPIVEQSEFRDFETLYSLLRDVPATFEAEGYSFGNEEIAKEINHCGLYYKFKIVIDAYQQRLVRLTKLHLFHEFAQKHPGMEHLGGVPKGGTFILVYVDGEEVDKVLAADKDLDIYELRRLRTENIQKSAAFPPDLYQEEISYPKQLLSELQKRKDVIVGDFCLPYRCSSNAPAVNYIVARQRPIILLNKIRFREDDDKKYEFILEPEGGTVRGEGVSYQENIQKYFFQPTSIGQISKDDLAKGLEVAIIFAYAIDDTYDTLTVTIYPLDAGFQIGAKENETAFCSDDKPVELKPNFMDGVTSKFIALDGETELENVIENNQFDPSKVELDENETQKVITIKHTITTQKGYEKSNEQQVTIFASPDGGFKIGEKPYKTSFCAYNNALELKPDLTGDKFTSEFFAFELDGKTKLDNVIEKNKFNPSKVELENDETKKIIIEHKIKHNVTSEKTCERSEQKQVTIFALPNADFKIGNQGKTRFPANHDLVDLTPNNIGDNFTSIFQVFDDKGNEVKGAIQQTDNLFKFDPSSVELDNKQTRKVTVKHTIEHSFTNDKVCKNSKQHKVEIVPPVNANLSITGGENFSNNGESVEIKLADGTPEDVELLEVRINDTPNRILNPSQYAKHGQPEDVTITVVIRSRETQYENTLTRTVIIHPAPNANLSIAGGENFCNNATPLEVTLAEETPEDVELIEVSINNTPTRILNPSQYAKNVHPEDVTIKAVIRSRETQYENTLTRTVTINSLPDANLSITSGENFCKNGESVEITLAEGTPEEVELLEVSINDTPTQILNPSQYTIDGQPEDVTIKAIIRDNQTRCENTLIRTVIINPIPLGDFQAEIANIYANVFSIRVFDIQPAQETSFSFNWEHPGGNRDTTNPGNNEFIINYDYDFNSWIAGAEVSITLQVSTPESLGSCTSEPVTKPIAIPFGGVQGFNLLTISNDGSRESRRLERDNTFKVSDFKPNYQYAIEAVTVPVMEDSVVFTYTLPNADMEESSPVSAPHYLPNGWQPIIGIHRIKAQAFRELNGDRLEGISSTVVIRVNEDGNNGENGTDTPTEPRSRSFTLLNRFRVLFEPDSKNTTESKIFS